MAFTIAMAGKGGVGKTTVSGLLVRYLVEKGMKPVLAVDADSNTNLNDVLGVELTSTLGEAREEMRSVSNASGTGMTKDMFIEMRVNQALVEDEGFDLIAMGKPEGAGCYCAANNLLTASMDSLAGNYKYLVVDNEAGMEHISRVTTQHVDMLLVVSDPSRRSLVSAKRVADLAKEMNILAGPIYLIVNMVRERDRARLEANVEELGLNLAGTLPDDDLLMEYDAEGKATGKLPADNSVVQAAWSIFDALTERHAPKK